MSGMEQLKARYYAYIRFNRELFAKARLIDGLFGLGNDPKKDPGHAQFYRDVAAIVEELASKPPTSEEAEEAVRWILGGEDLASGSPAAGWMMIAAQQHAEPLIPFLPPEAAAELLRQYSLRYPKRVRLPIQNHLIKSLRAQSKGAPRGGKSPGL